MVGWLGVFCRMVRQQDVQVDSLGVGGCMARKLKVLMVVELDGQMVRCSDVSVGAYIVECVGGWLDG